MSNMGEEGTVQSRRTILIISPKLLIIALLVAVIFASVGLQRASADDDEGNNDHNVCNDHHFTKCSHNDGTPIILPFP